MAQRRKHVLPAPGSSRRRRVRRNARQRLVRRRGHRASSCERGLETDFDKSNGGRSFSEQPQPPAASHSDARAGTRACARRVEGNRRQAAVASALCRSTAAVRGSNGSRRALQARPADSHQCNPRWNPGTQGSSQNPRSQRSRIETAELSASITILIPTFNRIRALEAVWPSYLVHPDVARIVVIDDGSTDGTSERVKELAKNSAIPVDVIRHETQKGQPASRLSGIQS